MVSTQKASARPRETSSRGCQGWSVFVLAAGCSFFGHGPDFGALLGGLRDPQSHPPLLFVLFQLPPPSKQSPAGHGEAENAAQRIYPRQLSSAEGTAEGEGTELRKQINPEPEMGWEWRFLFSFCSKWVKSTRPGPPRARQEGRKTREGSEKPSPELPTAPLTLRAARGKPGGVSGAQKSTPRTFRSHSLCRKKKNLESLQPVATACMSSAGPECVGRKAPGCACPKEPNLKVQEPSFNISSLKASQ